MATYPDSAVPAARRLGNESPVSAVSWAAIISGAVVAAAVSLLLFALGTGLGFASISAWPNAGATAATFSVLTAIWLIVIQWVASAFGGYTTGRLRTKWVSVHTHEVFFRDTAHGFITWAAATVITATVVALAAGAVVGAGGKAAATLASATGTVSGYSVDSLFRGDAAAPSGAANGPDVRAEATRILAKSLSDGALSADDRNYLAQIVAARTGLSAAEAGQRVDAIAAQVKAAEAKARQMADAARKVAATTSMFTALAMLIGAFIACIAAALGGRERDEHP